MVCPTCKMPKARGRSGETECENRETQKDIKKEKAFSPL